MVPPRPVAAVVLAAGEGRRMGGPKALLLVKGRPLVLQHVERFRKSGCDRVLVVSRPQVAAVIESLGPRDARVCIVAAESASQSASLALALRAQLDLSPIDAVDWLVTPVDLLPPRPDTLRSLVSQLRAGALAATPTFRGKGGHPVAIRGELLAPYRSGPPEDAPPLRDVLARAGARRVRVEVEDGAVVGDLDTAADAAAIGETHVSFSRGAP